MKNSLRWTLFFLLFFLFSTILVCARVQTMQTHIAQSVLRLHVLANSDSETDQAIKFKVRDRLLEDFGYLFSDCTTAREAARTAEAHLKDFEASAAACLADLGVCQSVSAKVVPSTFPTKSYGPLSLPAGTYTALQIAIGDAHGQNWWCVMYPPLCLTPSTISADEETLSVLKDSLSKEEFDLLVSRKKVDVKIKFKLAEWLSSLK